MNAKCTLCHELFTFADLKNAFDLLQYVRDDDPDAAVIVQLMNEVSATVANPNHAKVAGVGVLINAMIDGLNARVQSNKPRPGLRLQRLPRKQCKPAK